jgi:hypothetical protein
MNWLPGAARKHAARILALLLLLVLYSATRIPQLPAETRNSLAERFRFSAEALATWPQATYQTARNVNPSLEQHSAWISAVGAAVALADLDADGLANDVCLVDPRTDRVTIAPVPGTGDRYPMISLEANGLTYNRESMAPMGCIPGDFNEDGRMDLFVYYWGRTPIFYFDRAPSAGAPNTERYVARAIRDGDERWFTNAATFADLDGDGHLDLVVGNYFQDGARILDTSATNADYMQHSMSRAFNGGVNRVFRFVGARTGDNPGVDFEEMEGVFERDAARAWTLAIGAADLDGDLLPELYFANDFGPDRFFHNRSSPGKIRLTLLEGERGLTTPRSKVLGRDSFKGMGVDFADVNADERLDFFVSNIAAEYALLESHFLFVSEGPSEDMAEGVAPYVDKSEGMGVSRSDWGWDTRFGDFDNDGVAELLQATGFAKGEVDRWPELQELAMANDELLRFASSWPRFQAGDDLSGNEPNPFYVRGDDGRYYDLSSEIGIADPFVTRGIATADVDGDGDLDFAIANQWETSFFYRNESPDLPAFLGLHLLHPTRDSMGSQTVQVSAGHPSLETPGRPAVGAAARLVRSDGEVLVAQVDGGNGHSGVRSPDLHFGLGDTEGEQVTVSIRYRDRHGTPGEVRLALAPGWHTVILPDATSNLKIADRRNP